MTSRATKKLTDAGVARLKPGRTEYIVRDTRIAGLGVRVRTSGHCSFIWLGSADDGGGERRQRRQAPPTSPLAMRRFPDDRLHDEYGLTRPRQASSSRYAAPAPSTNHRE